MEFQFGRQIEKHRLGEPLVFDTLSAITGHGLFLGSSGSGKTHNLRECVRKVVRAAAAARQGILVHVIDPHGDIAVPGASTVVFSEASDFGFNPLEINPDPEYGGVRRQIQRFIGAVKRQKVLGSKQESALRYLLEDLYAARGFTHDPQTWREEDPAVVRAKLAGKENRLYLDVAYSERERFKALVKDPRTGNRFGDFDRELLCWWVEREHYGGDLLMWEPKVLFKSSPTLDDAVLFTKKKLESQFLGANGACIQLLYDANRAAAAFNRRVIEYQKRGEVLPPAEAEKLRLSVDASREKAVAAFDSYLASIENGRELDDVIRYNSLDVLTYVYERLQNLRSMGIFRSGTPPFDPRCPIRRYQIKPLLPEEQRLFVSVLVGRIFERAVQRGEQKDVVEIVVVDESKRFLDEEEDNILNVLANEARKFGLALWAAGQSPEHFPPDFIKNTAFKMILGLDDGDHKMAERKLGTTEAATRQIQPRRSALIQIKNSGATSSSFVHTLVNESDLVRYGEPSEHAA